MTRATKAAALPLLVALALPCAAESPYHVVPLKPYIEGAYASELLFRPDAAFPQDQPAADFDGVPIALCRDANGDWRGVDVGLSKWRSMDDDERTLSFYPGWCRASAKDGDLVLHLPKALYFRAHLLAAALDDQSRDPVLTLRTGLLQNRGYLADVTVNVPTPGSDQSPAALRTVPGQFVSKAGKATKGRLFLIPIHLPIGKFLRVAGDPGKPDPTGKGPLDVQLTGRLHVKVSAPDPANFSVMPLGLPSGVQVFGITFERSPVSLAVEGASTWNIFPHAMRPVMNLSVANLTDAPRDLELTAQWTRHTRAPKSQVRSVSWKVALAAGETKEVKHEVAAEEFGKHDYSVSVKDAKLGELLTHHTTLARLPQFPDAPLEPGLRSRFCVWWWNGSHSTLGANAGLDAVDWLGLGYIHWFSANKETPEQTKARGLRHYFGNAILCLHEFNISGPQMMQYPTLMTGEPRYKLNEQEEARFQATWKESVAKCEKTRAEKPGTEIIFGNSSFNGIEEFLYRKFPSDLFDSLGHEACALMRMPERQPELAAVQEAYWFKRALEEYGYKQPLTGCAEGRYHSTNPGNHTEQAQADLYVRDMLHDLAYGFSRICPATLDDVGNGYYWANWGASGLVTRAPDVHPKLSYVAYAVAAHVLSDADFVRAVPTGSHSAYCLEFDRRRGDKVLACWTIRGARPMTLRVRPERKLGLVPKGMSLTDQQGNSTGLRRTAGSITFQVSPSPVFIEGVKACKGVELGTPTHSALPKAKLVPIHELDSLKGWRSATEPRSDLDNDNFDMPRQKGVFEVAAVEDSERGTCLQFSLTRLADRPPWVPAYEVLSLNEPILVTGKPTAIGLYVRGNSGWGRVNLELRDAKGERWLSVGMPNAWNANDEQSVSYIVHDGWRWMEIPLPGHYPGGFHWPRYANWRHDDGDGIVDYPLSLTAIIVEQRQKIVYVTEMVDASAEPVRLSDLTAVYGDPEQVGDWEERMLE